MAKRPLTPAEIAELRTAGHELPANAIIDDVTGDVMLSDPGPQENPVSPVTPKPKEWGEDTIGFVGRQIAHNAIPAAAGGVLGGAGTGFMAGAGAGPIGMAAGGIIGGLIGGFGAKKLQDKALRSYAESNPNSQMASSVAKVDEDIRNHPYLSTAASLPAAVFGGGSVLPNVDNLIANPKAAAKIAGIMIGADAATQLTTTGTIDPIQSIISGAGGSLFGGSPKNTVARATTAIAPVRTKLDTLRGKNVPTVESLPIHQRPGYNEADLLNASPEVLNQIAGQTKSGEANFYRELARLKSSNANITPELLTRLSTEGPGQGYDKVAMRILAEQLPKQEAVGAELAVKKKIDEAITTPEQAAKVAAEQAALQEAKNAPLRQRATEEGVRSMSEKTQKNPPAPTTAEQSAETILQQGSVEAAVKRVASKERELKALEKKASEYLEGSPERDLLTRYMLRKRQEIDAEFNAALEGRGTPPLNTAATTEEITTPRELEPIKTITGDESPEVPQPAAQTPPQAPEIPAAPAPKVAANPGKTGGAAEPNPQPVSREVEELKSVFEKLKTQRLPGDPVPEAPVVGAPKTVELGVAPKPGQQKSAALVDPIGLVRDSIQKPGKAYDELRRIVESHPNYQDWRAANPEQPLRMFFEMLPDSHKRKINTYWEAGATAIPKTVMKTSLLTPEAQRLVEKKGTTPVLDINKAEDFIVNKLKSEGNAVEGEWTYAGLRRVLGVENSTNFQRFLEAGLIKRLANGNYEFSDSINRKLIPKIVAPNKGMKGGQSGSVLNPFRGADEVYERVKNAVKSGVGKVVSTAGKVSGLETFKKGVTIGGKTIGGIEGELEGLARKSPLGGYVARAIRAMNRGQWQIEGPEQQVLQELNKKLGSDIEALHSYLMERKYNGESKIPLNENQQEALNVIDNIVQGTGKAKSEFGPYVWRYDSEGRHIQTPAEVRPGWFPEPVSAEVQRALRNKSGDEARWNKLREDYIAWKIDKEGMTAEAAEKAFLNHLDPRLTGEKSAPNPEFRSLRFEEGSGLPPSWRETNPIQAMKTYMTKYSHDMAFHKYMESDPIVGKALGFDDNGRGEVLPESVVGPDGKPITAGELRGDANIQNSMRHYTGGFSGVDQGLERFTHSVTALSLQTITQAKNFIASPFLTMRELKISEYPQILKGVLNAFDKTARDTAIAGGSARATRNVLPSIAQDAEHAVTKLNDLILKGTYSEQLSTANDVMLDVIGRGVAKQRILDGDIAFIEKNAPPRWREMDLEEVIDHIAANFTRKYSGSYGPEDLPNSMLRGAPGVLGRFLSLSRWSVSQANNFYNDVYEPATKGDLAPALKAFVGGMLGAEALNAFTEMIYNRKPKELTIPEWLKLDGEDSVYTVFSRLATASTMGVLGDLAFAGIQKIKGENPREFGNLAIQAAADLGTRLGQFGAALSDGKTGFWDGLATTIGAIAKDRIQLWKVAMSKGDEKGVREERIARRLGYLPKGSSYSGGLNDPFSEAEAYRNEDVESLSELLKRKRKSGQMISLPDNEVRTTKMLKDNKIVDYYRFIEEAQGKEAADAARKRDVDNTMKKRKLLSTAMRQ